MDLSNPCPNPIYTARDTRRRRRCKKRLETKCVGNANSSCHRNVLVTKTKPYMYPAKKTAKATRTGRILSRPLRTSSAPSSVYFIYCETREWMMTSASDEKLPAARRQWTQTVDPSLPYCHEWSCAWGAVTLMNWARNYAGRHVEGIRRWPGLASGTRCRPSSRTPQRYPPSNVT